MKVETFKNINDAVNYVLDKNLYHINIAKFEEQLMDRHAYKSQTYNIIFLIDEHGILTTD
jgi:sensor domain CHASE-containing protein